MAANPVLVKGGHVWYEDAEAEGGVNSFEAESEGCEVESFHPFSTDHNILEPDVALGTGGCGDCHRGSNGGEDTVVFDRLILIDPFGTDGSPVYQNVREMTGVDPF